MGSIPRRGGNFFCLSKLFRLFYYVFQIPRIFLSILASSPQFFNQISQNFQKKKFELARGPINTGKIRIGEGTSIFIRITEHFELLDFELVSFDCIHKIVY